MFKKNFKKVMGILLTLAVVISGLPIGSMVAYADDESNYCYKEDEKVVTYTVTVVTKNNVDKDKSGNPTGTYYGYNEYYGGTAPSGTLTEEEYNEYITKVGTKTSGSNNSYHAACAYTLTGLNLSEMYWHYYNANRGNTGGLGDRLRYYTKNVKDSDVPGGTLLAGTWTWVEDSKIGSKHHDQCNMTLIKFTKNETTKTNYYDHDYQKTTVPATCEEDGYEEYVCKNDPSHTYKNTLNKTGHDATHHDAVAYTTENYTGHPEYWTCSNSCCEDKKFKDAECTTEFTDAEYNIQIPSQLQIYIEVAKEAIALYNNHENADLTSADAIKKYANLTDAMKNVSGVAELEAQIENIVNHYADEKQAKKDREANELAKAKEDANKVIDELKYLSDEEKNNYKNEVSGKNNIEDVNKIVQDAKDKNNSEQNKVEIKKYCEKKANDSPIYDLTDKETKELYNELSNIIENYNGSNEDKDTVKKAIDDKINEAVQKSAQNKADKEAKEKAQHLIDLINALPNPDTASDDDIINAADDIDNVTLSTSKDFYDIILNDINNVNTHLVSDELLQKMSKDAARLLTLRNEVSEVEKLINKINTPVTLNDENAIKEARDAYKELCYKQKELVNSDVIKKLTDAENDLTTLKNNQGGGDTPVNPPVVDPVIKDKDVQNVEDLINNIESPIDSNDKEAIEKAREEYNKLSDEQKKEVENYDALVQAEKEYEEAIANNPQSTITLNKGLKVSQTKSQINVSWGEVEGADYYKVYYNYCGKSSVTKYNAKTTNAKYVVKKIGGKKIDLKKNYKVQVRAYATVNGETVCISKSIIAHVVGKNNTKYTNPKGIKLGSSNVTLNVGGTSKIKATTIKVNSKKSILPKTHASEFRYRSGDKNVCTVTNGTIKAKGAGTTNVYVYAKNGYCKTIKVTVLQDNEARYRF